MFKISGFTMIAASILWGLASATGPPAFALNRHVTVTNNTRTAIVEIHVSNAGTGNWQEDILGRDFLLPGDSLLVDVDDRSGRCRLDFKAVFDDGASLIRRDVNVCGIESYAISYR